MLSALKNWPIRLVIACLCTTPIAVGLVLLGFDAIERHPERAEVILALPLVKELGDTALFGYMAVLELLIILFVSVGLELLYKLTKRS